MTLLTRSQPWCRVKSVLFQLQSHSSQGFWECLSSTSDFTCPEKRNNAIFQYEALVMCKCMSVLLDYRLYSVCVLNMRFLLSQLIVFIFMYGDMYSKSEASGSIPLHVCVYLAVLCSVESEFNGWSTTHTITTTTYRAIYIHIQTSIHVRVHLLGLCCCRIRLCLYRLYRCLPPLPSLLLLKNRCLKCFAGVNSNKEFSVYKDNGWSTTQTTTTACYYYYYYFKRYIYTTLHNRVHLLGLCWCLCLY